MNISYPKSKLAVTCCLVGFIWAVLCPVGQAQTVYVVLGSDTSIWWNTQGGDVAYTYENEFDFDVFANSDGVYGDIMDPSFRNAHTDSLGHPFPFTWYMHGGGWFLKGTNTTAVTTTYLIKKHWGAELQTWGDELAYHFHHFQWDGQWIMADTFPETIWDFDWTMAQMMIDEGVFPMSFRSGWNYMDNDYQQYLEKWIPYRMEGGSWMTQSVPYHPSFSNYQLPGTMKGWEVRHYYMKSFTQTVADQLFAWADAGTDQVACIWSHQNETDFINQIATVDTVLHNAATTYPSVQFRYCTGIDAMKQWQGTTDNTKPPLEISFSRQGYNALVSIESEPDIFQQEPIVAARQYDMQYVRLPTTLSSPGNWRLEYSLSDIDRVAVGVSDIYGNATLQEVKDGSRRWTTQSELGQGNPEDINIEKYTNRAILATELTSTPTVNQPLSDSQTDILKRSYWIAQGFVPQATGLSAVNFGATVIGSPAQYLVELRKALPSGFPDDTPGGLLASGTATLDHSGTTTAYLTYDGLVLDGRQYTLVFKILSGQGEIYFKATDVYPDGMLLRAYSLDWITISYFDCYFQTFDQYGHLDQSQPLIDANAYVSEQGRFVSQTFQADLESIGAIEVSVATAGSGETLGIQLRKTLPDGGPDLSFDALIYKTEVAISGPGIYTATVDWPIPAELRHQSLALTFVCPMAGANSIRLHHQSSDEYPQGQLYVSEDTNTVGYPGADLYLKVFGLGLVPHGTLTWDFDAGAISRWLSGSWSASLPSAQTRVRARFKFADSQAALETASWTSFIDTSPFALMNAPESRWVRAQIVLESLDGLDSPVLDDLEIFYTPPLTAVSPKLWTLY